MNTSSVLLLAAASALFAAWLWVKGQDDDNDDGSNPGLTKARFFEALGCHAGMRFA